MANANTAPRVAFCQRLGGVYDENGATCTLQKRSDGMQPSCMKAAADKFFSDELGACYDFQRLDNSVYRQRYRLTSTCLSQLDRFEEDVMHPETGVCASVDEWRGAPGVFVPSPFPRISIPKTQKVQECSVHRSRSRCETGLCTWSETPTYIQCLDKSPNDCIATCTTMGGEMDGVECVVPKCRPTQMSDAPC